MKVNKLIVVSLFLIASLKSMAQETFLLNYQDVDITKVTQDISKFSKKTLILDPRVKGRISIFSDSILSSEQVWDVYLRTIQVHGFAALSDGGIVRIVPENEATRDSSNSQSSASIATKIFTLKNRSAGEILPQIKAITGRQSHLSSIPSINSILLVDKLSNIERIEKLLMTLDQNDSAAINIIKLNNLSSVEAVRILDRLKAQNNPTITNFIAVPFTPSNSVILSADQVVTRNITDTLKALDQDALTGGSIAVIYLKYAKAEEVAAIINTVSIRFSGENADKPVVTHHRETNSLIISSEETNLDLIKNLVSKLDIRRAQVLVEAIIVELSETAARNLGVETVFAGAQDGNIPIGITRFQNGANPDLLSIAGSAIEQGNNATLSNLATTSLLNSSGLVSGFGDLSGGDSFAGIISAVADDQNSDILSTHTIIAMDNEPAHLVIGQEIPITTGESLGSSNANPFRTTSRQEVGIKLSITPQINEGNSVILEIKQEVSGIVGPLTGTADLITNKRSIETTVLVDNNQMIVLGGLNEDDLQESTSRVPILGSIPLLGKLFSSSAESRVQRNLMVFLRPTILIDSDDVSSLSGEKYNYINAEAILRSAAEIPVIDLTN
ncbi:type II secretion system protein GspD [Gammaproteobacteria bacterium]|nr:type II secretion system protein GspD [Gammaproteobacteria bacterium]MDA9370599.1 type II secretion system protein GspD [Gammaproteobacteria bacterium]MDC1475714.1 type II secretion system protein GspD [Gammaproteobacteria bacterium]|tara:strand:- start:5033 stop:6874 length:1842 start_codon:yes stop_codon:yes gene_type:complete